MPRDKKININISEPKNGIIEIREGDALPLKEPLKIRINGTINAPLLWLTDNGKQVKAGESYAVCNMTNRNITYYENSRSEYGAVVTGRLKVNPKIEALNINTGVMSTVKQLVTMLRMNRLMFADKEAFKKLLDNLMNFTASFKMEVEQKDNRKGDTTDSIVTRLKTSIELSFKLRERLYLGSAEKMIFFVDAVPEVSDGTVKFYLESPELNEHLESEAEKAMSEVSKAIRETYKVTVVEEL